MGRRLRPDERELWDKVKETTTPIRPKVAPPPAPVIDPVFERAVPPVQETKIPDFRIGSRAKAGKVPAKTPAPPTMDSKTFGKMVRGRLSPEATLDLHGMTVSEAHPELINFILTAAQRRLRLVLVITGKGRNKGSSGPIPERVGVLKHSVPMWLNQAPVKQAILDVSAAHQRHGGGGAFYVYLRRRR